jgi:hypothetical protein
MQEEAPGAHFQHTGENDAMRAAQNAFWSPQPSH